MPPLLAEDIQQQVAGDLKQPAAKRSALGIRHPLPRRPCDRAKHVLAQIAGIRVLQSPAPRQSIDQRLINGDKLRPRRLIARILNP